MAPDFSVVGSDGRTYRLADFRGKQAVVLAWFAKAFTVVERRNASHSVRVATRSAASTSAFRDQRRHSGD